MTSATPTSSDGHLHAWVNRPPAYPAWPVGALFGLLPLWWAAGLVDLILILIAGFMALYMVNAGGVRVPRGFSLWLLFLVWMLCSFVQVDTPNHLIAFVYRALIYLAATVLFLYVFNSPRTLTDRFVVGSLTIYWLWTVLGGVLGALLPSEQFRTPAFYLLRELAPGVVFNEFVNHMVVRHFAQFNPDSYLRVAPRPSAPFLYANNWGNAYSLLVPFVMAYLVLLWKRERPGDTVRFWLLTVALALSLVPASLTLNRGMLIGLGVAALYISVKLTLQGKVVAVSAILILAAVGAAVFNVVAASRLETRLEGAGTETRAALYAQALAMVPESPLFGFGVPPTSADPGSPPVGTQGQFWMILISHGPVATAAFVGWFLLAWWRSRRRRDAVGVVASTVCLVSVAELGFYGVLPYGLPIMMIAAGLALRGPAGPAIADVTEPVSVVRQPSRAQK